MPEGRQKRRIKIIKPRLQLKLVAIFVGLSLLGGLLQSLLIGYRLTELSTRIPAGGQSLVDSVPGLLLEVLLFSFGLILPLTFAVGVLATHRIAGPIYRFEQYLMQVARGEQIGPCRIRKGDELNELCEIINVATEPLRRESPGQPESEAAA